ncbi:histidine phosphatase family protein [Aeromicrobium sp. A1-2]|uniref:histidine phosphatase family protein n=1 Tax=Aeromicrobium sp. A1-2 TaxID=2107713 RepID=UPI0013C34EA0|nr:histidine phosphatase family protein [Aeromicrobium sp. A1-2]
MGTIYLVRHGQASFGSDDYDKLSQRGHEQAARLGSSWASAGIVPTRRVSGSMRRQRETATGVVAAGDAGAPHRVDPQWNEFEHVGMTAQHAQDSGGDQKVFQASLNLALAQWMSGEGDFPESYADFCTRIRTGFADVVAAAGPGGKVAVFSSAGPIALVVSHLLTASDALFTTLNDVVVNASVTTVIVGRTGPRLLTFNDHAHVLPGLATYR